MSYIKKYQGIFKKISKHWIVNQHCVQLIVKNIKIYLHQQSYHWPRIQGNQIWVTHSVTNDHQICKDAKQWCLGRSDSKHLPTLPARLPSQSMSTSSKNARPLTRTLKMIW